MGFCVLVVLEYNSLFFSHEITLESSFVDLKQAICDKWPELRCRFFELYFLRGDKKRVIEDDGDLHSLGSYVAALGLNSTDIHLQILEPSSISTKDSCNAASSSSILSASCSSDLNEVGGSELVVYKSMGWSSFFTGVGQTFNGGAEELRLALTKYSCESGYKFVFKRNAFDRITVECKKACGWSIHATIASGDTKLRIHKCCLVHSCGGMVRDFKKPGLTSKLVHKMVVANVRDKPDVKPKELMDDVKRDFGYEMNYTMAYNAKHLSLEQVYGTADSSFNRLVSYKEALLASNPGSEVLLESFAESDKFRRIFICLRACIDGFGFCRPFIYLDGTFCVEKFTGCLLAACTKNGNNELYPIAFAIVDSETSENWHWFLRALKTAIGFSSRCLTFISDRHKGLVSSIPDVFPNSYHSYCVWHMDLNLRNAISGSKERRKLIHTKFWDLARAPTHREFSIILEELYALDCPNAVDFVKSVSPVHWSNAYFKGQRFGNLSSSLAECFNNWIKHTRTLPITAMLDGIRLQMMKKISEHQDDSMKMSDFLTPKYHTLLEMKENLSRSFHLSKSSDSVFEVHAEESYLVDLSQYSCSCNLWSIDGFPCAHAIAAIKTTSMKVTDFIDPCFYTSYYRATYSFPIYPVVAYDKAETVPKVPELLPSDSKRTPGRPMKHKRIPNKGSKPFKRKMVCGTCKRLGAHNCRTCKKQ